MSFKRLSFQVITGNTSLKKYAKSAVFPLKKRYFYCESNIKALKIIKDLRWPPLKKDPKVIQKNLDNKKDAPYLKKKKLSRFIIEVPRYSVLCELKK